MTLWSEARMGKRKNFNSHARVGRDPVNFLEVSFTLYFNSHARVGRDKMELSWNGKRENFNSHARVGRDAHSQKPVVCPAKISTHTPAWGVTF